MTRESARAEEEQIIDLKDPVLAAFLAWLIPGLGHLYQRRTGKAVLFFVCIMSTFVYGVYLGGSKELGWGRVVYASWRQGDKRLNYFCQVGAGLIALPALVQTNRVNNGKEPLFGGFMAPPRLGGGHVIGGQLTLDELHKKLHRFFELATVFTMVAGLLNLLAIYDAWGGPVFPETAEDEEDAGQGDSEADSD